MCCAHVWKQEFEAGMQKALDAEELAEFAVEGDDADFAGVRCERCWHVLCGCFGPTRCMHDGVFSDPALSLLLHAPLSLLFHAHCPESGIACCLQPVPSCLRLQQLCTCLLDIIYWK